MNYKLLIKDYKLWLLVFLALILRLYLATLPGFKIDLDSFFAWAIRLVDLGPTGFYSKDVFTDYTPGYLYVLTLLGFIGKFLNPSQFYFVLKLPAILAEVGLGIFVYLVCKQHKFTIKKSLLFSSLILFNPALFFNSSVWGQVDSVLTLLMVLTIYFLNQRKYVTSSALLGLTFLIKPQTISIFPVFLLFLIKNKTTQTMVKILIPALATIFVLSLPFFLADPFFGLFNKVLETSKEYPYTSLFAFNFWGMIGMWLNDLDKWYYSLSYQNWGYLLFGIFWIISAYYYFKKNLPLYTLSALATLGFYFLPTKVHDRYLYPALVFLLLSAIELRSKWILIAQILLSLTHFLNIYYVYTYYNFYYLHSDVAFFNQNLYNLIDQNLKLFSVISTVIFILVSLIIFQTNVKKSFQKS